MVKTEYAPPAASPEVKAEQNADGPDTLRGGGSAQPPATQNTAAAAPAPAPAPAATLTAPVPTPVPIAPVPVPAPAPVPAPTPAPAQHSQPAPVPIAVVEQVPQQPPPVPMYAASREGVRDHLLRRLAQFYAEGHGDGTIGRAYLTPIVGPNGGPSALDKQRKRFIHHYHDRRVGGTNTLLFVPHSYADQDLREYQAIHDAIEELTRRYGRDQAYVELEWAMTRIAKWIARQGGGQIKMHELEDFEGWDVFTRPLYWSLVDTATQWTHVANRIAAPPP
jgi:hypothetical protein